MPPPKKPRKGRQGVVIAFKLDGVEYRFDQAALENRHELELFQQAGLTFPQLGKALKSGAGASPFVIAAIAFLARRQAGDQAVTYDGLLASIDRGTSEFVPVEAEGEAPEA